MKIKLAVIAGLVALGVGQIIVAEMMPTEQQLQPPPWLKLKAMETIRPPPWLIYKGTEDASEAPSAYWTLRVEIDAYVISNPNEHMWVCTGSFTPGPGCSMYSPPDNLQQCGSWFEPVVQLFSNSSGSCSTLGQPFIETLWIGTTASNAQHVADAYIKPKLISAQDCFWMATTTARVFSPSCPTPTPTPTPSATPSPTPTP